MAAGIVHEHFRLNEAKIHRAQRLLGARTLGRQYGYEQIGRGRLTNDALIAMSAARCGYMILTRNARDFSRLAELRPFRYKLATGFAAS